MDPAKYKDVKVQRGYTYHYYYTPASSGKPTLFFIHGFPSTSFDWSHQVAYFEPKGYGILVPDCLGYGGTSTPTGVEEFRLKLIAQDLIDILDGEGPKTVIGIGHDWGSTILSRLAIEHQDRFIAFAWLALAYNAPSESPFDLEATLAFMRHKVGSDVFGYWEYFNQADAHVTIDKNIDSFLQLVYPATPEVWSEWLCPVGKVQEWIESNRRPGRASWLTEKEYSTMREALGKPGLQSSLNYYKAFIRNANLADDQAIPEENLKIKKPALFIATTRDVVCLPAFGKANMQQHIPHAEITEVNTGHWAQLEAAEEVNAALDKWVQNLAVGESEVKL